MAKLMKFTSGARAQALNHLGESTFHTLKEGVLREAEIYLGEPPEQSPARAHLTAAHQRLCREFKKQWNEFVASTEKALVDVRHLDAQKGIGD